MNALKMVLFTKKTTVEEKVLSYIKPFSSITLVEKFDDEALFIEKINSISPDLILLDTFGFIVDINSMLNYGYAIVRGAVARTLAVHGYQQSFGLKHKSVLNSFNLSDDIIEPFRPFVDLYAVKAQVNEDDEGLSREVKRDLLALLDKEVVSGEEKHALNYAVERTVSSLTRSLESGEASLILPEIVKDAKTHRYE